MTYLIIIDAGYYRLSVSSKKNPYSAFWNVMMNTPIVLYCIVKIQNGTRIPVSLDDFTLCLNIICNNY